MEKVFLNGKPVDTNLPLRALFFGEGLFESFRYRLRIPLHIDKHYSRMERGAGILGIPFIERGRFLDVIDQSVKEAGIEDAYVKVCLLSKGGLNYYEHASDGDIAVIVKEYEPRERAIKTCISKIRRSSESPIHRFKSLNYLENILARRESITGGCDESILLNERGEVAEGSASNIFWVKGNTLYTPSIECGILPGTTRELLLSSAGQLGLEAKEGFYSPESLSGSSCVFLTNALIGSLRVTNFNQLLLFPNSEQYEAIKKLLLTKLGWI